MPPGDSRDGAAVTHISRRRNAGTMQPGLNSCEGYILDEKSIFCKNVLQSRENEREEQPLVSNHLKGKMMNERAQGRSAALVSVGE